MDPPGGCPEAQDLPHQEKFPSVPRPSVVCEHDDSDPEGGGGGLRDANLEPLESNTVQGPAVNYWLLWRTDGDAHSFHKQIARFSPLGMPGSWLSMYGPEKL